MRLLVGPLLALSLAGCSNCISLPGAPAPGAAVAPAGVPVAPATVPARYGNIVDGVVRYFGAPIAGAAVTAHNPDTGALLATATAAPDGTFRIVLPEGTAPGTIVELLGQGGGHRVANYATVSERTLLQVSDRTLLQVPKPAVVLDAAETAALMVLAPRLIAAIRLGTPEAKAAALASLAAAAVALGSTNAAALLDPAHFDAVVGQVLDTAGLVLETPVAREAVAAAIPASAIAAITAQADALAVVIRQVVADGHARPDSSLIGPLAVGPQVVAAVFVDPTDSNPPDTTNPPATNPTIPSSGGSSSGGTQITFPDIGAVVDLAATPPADGTYAPPTVTISGSAQ